ncbi:MAG TPA: ABC transporter permease [Oculatellaceae cyanobacterium]|jgi:peptide/nickel transport system permease protein
MSIPLYILKRILTAIPTLLIISFLGFFLMRYNFSVGPIDIPVGQGQVIHVLDRYTFKNPIDPLAGYRNNPQISAAALAEEEKRLGLDQPMLVQYWLWLTNLLQFHPEELLKGNLAGFFTPNLGKTFSGEDVADLIARRAGNTLILNLIVVVLTWLIAVPPGVFSALNWRKLSDRSLTVLSSIGMSFPDFVLALLAAKFAVESGLFPLGGIVSDQYELLGFFEKIWDRAMHLVLPVFVLTIGGLASLQRQMRGNLLDVLNEEYIRTARAKGLPEDKVIYKHAVRNALNPLISIMGLTFAELLSGALLIEKILGYPGLGQLTYKAAIDTDTNLVMASLIMASAMLVAGNLLADVLLKLADPRIELEG